MVTVGETIFQQIGANRTAAAFGMKHIAQGERGLSFHVGSGARCGRKAIKFISVRLNNADTYSVCAYDRNCAVVREVEGVMAGQLVATLEAMTGFVAKVF